MSLEDRLQLLSCINETLRELGIEDKGNHSVCSTAYIPVNTSPGVFHQAAGVYCLLLGIHVFSQVPTHKKNEQMDWLHTLTEIVWTQSKAHEFTAKHTKYYTLEAHKIQIVYHEYLHELDLNQYLICNYDSSIIYIL